MPAHPALRLLAPLLDVAVAEVVLEELVGLPEVEDPVKEGVDAISDVPEDG